MDTLDTVNSRVAAFSDWAPTVLRLGAGIVFLVYGTGKIFGVGPQGVGIEGFTGFLSTLGVPAPGVFAWVVAFVEFVGGLALLVGAFTRVFAGLIAVDMVFAILLWHLPKGWDYQSGGFEYPLVLLFVTVTLVLAGPGRLSLDHLVLDTEPTPVPASASGYEG